jgi:hypothetical protein
MTTEPRYQAYLGESSSLEETTEKVPVLSPFTKVQPITSAILDRILDALTGIDQSNTSAKPSPSTSASE